MQAAFEKIIEKLEIQKDYGRKRILVRKKDKGGGVNDD